MEWKEIKPCFIFNFVLTDEVPSYSTLPGSNSFCNTIWSHLLTIIGSSIHLSQHLVKQTIRSAERERASSQRGKSLKMFLSISPRFISWSLRVASGHTSPRPISNTDQTFMMMEYILCTTLAKEYIKEFNSGVKTDEKVTVSSPTPVLS